MKRKKSLIIASVITVLSGCTSVNEGMDDKVNVETMVPSNTTALEINEADSDYIYDQLSEDEKDLFDQMREQCEQFYYGNEEPDTRKSVRSIFSWIRLRECLWKTENTHLSLRKDTIVAK